MFKWLKKRMGFADLSPLACSLIVSALESGRSLWIEGDRVKAGLGSENYVEGAKGLVAELEKFDLISFGVGPRYEPTLWARKQYETLREINDYYFASSMPKELRDFFNRSRIESGTRLWFRLRGSLVVMKAFTTCVEEKPPISELTFFNGYGETIGFLTKERLVADWHPVGFIGAPTDSCVLELLNKFKQIDGRLTTRAEHIANLLKK